MGPWSNGGRLRLGDRTALPLPACHKGVYARLRRAMERSEFARSSRKFRVRGPLRESELSWRGTSPSTSLPLWRGPPPPPPPPPPGGGGGKKKSPPPPPPRGCFWDYGGTSFLIRVVAGPRVAWRGGVGAAPRGRAG